MKLSLQILLNILTVFLTVKLSSAQSFGKLQGKVIDQITRQPIPGSNVILENTNFGAAADVLGNFKIENIPIGRYQIRVSSIGYQTQINPDIVVSTGHTVALQFELIETVIPLKGEVQVHAEFFRKDPSQLVSTHSLSYEEIRRTPGAAGDISRVVLSLPGVITAADDRNDLLVRGGNPTENLNLIDNIEIPNLNHFGTQGASGGPIGMVKTEFIREVNFSSGGFPVKYGERLSSVMDIKLREGNREEFQADLNLSMAGFGGSLEGPLFEKGSWIFSARKSYLDLIAKLNATSVATAIPHYSNYQTKIVYDIDENNQLSFIGLGGMDRVSFQEGEYNLVAYFKEYEIEHSQNQFITGLNWRTLWSKNSYSLLTLSNSYNDYASDVIQAKSKKEYYFNHSFEREIHLKGEFNVKINPSFEINLGGGFKWINLNHSIFYQGDTIYTIKNGIVDTSIFSPLDYSFGEWISKTFAYAQITNWIYDKLKFVTGIRYDNFSFIEKSNAFSFRGGLSYFLTPISSVNFSAGIYYQTPPYIWLSADPTSRKLENMRADHFVFGFEHYFSDDLKLSLESYQKNYSKIPTSKTVPQFIASNGGTDYGVFMMRNLTSDGKGYARGIEFTLQKKLLNDFYGIISYGHSKVKFTPIDGVERPGSFDFRNVFTLVFGYIPNDRYEFSFKWRYAGGRPYTPFDENLSKLFKREVLDFEQMNALRYKDYHRLDIRFDRRWHFEKWNIVTYFELQNAYFKKNIYEYQWDSVENKEIEVYQWRFFPIGGLTIEF
ncbi:MAG: TonB-dependent receptor [Ignavibacteria bacterium]|nr:TonB-dependent receptor [Ignavibacteria bacterium]